MAKTKAAGVSEVEQVPADRGGGGAEKVAPPPFGTPKPAGPVMKTRRSATMPNLARHGITARWR